jgi:hypothetical protein
MNFDAVKDHLRPLSDDEFLVLVRKHCPQPSEDTATAESGFADAGMRDATDGAHVPLSPRQAGVAAGLYDFPDGYSKNVVRSGSGDK